MKHLRNLKSRFSIDINPDEDGFVGRQCPEPECEGYFKIQLGKGLNGENLPCHCPYCGHKADADNSFTKAQIEYAEWVALREFTGTLLRDLESVKFGHRPSDGFGIGLGMKITGQATQLSRYMENKLETEVVFNRCKLRYTIYGLFEFCPDCAVHNSLQILKKNLELVIKLSDLAETQERLIAQQLVENALEDCVSASDGLGREACRVYSSKAVRPEKAFEIRFQNVVAARERVKEQFALDFAATIEPVDLAHILRAFQKRHLLSHKIRVIDEEYLSATGESSSLLGRKVSITSFETRELTGCLQVLGTELFRLMEANP